MATPDMSPSAVTVRLLRTEQLRRLCLALRAGVARSASSAGPGATRDRARPPAERRGG